MDRTVQIGDLPTPIFDLALDRFEKPCGIGSGPLRIGIGKPFPDVPQTASAQECIRNCMQEDVGIAVADQSLMVRDGDSAKNQRHCASQPMGIVTETNSGIRDFHADLMQVDDVRTTSRDHLDRESGQCMQIL